MEKLDKVIFYVIDKTIKTYRQFGQRRLTEAGLDITIDQWLVMNSFVANPDISQNEIAEKVFKDSASVTRIIDLLVTKKLLKRNVHPADRRRTQLVLTQKGEELLAAAQKVVNKYRSQALKDIEDNHLDKLRNTLQNIIDNCNNA